MKTVYRESQLVEKIYSDIKQLTPEERFELFSRFSSGKSYCMRCHECVSTDIFNHRSCHCKKKSMSP